MEDPTEKLLKEAAKRSEYAEEHEEIEKDLQEFMLEIYPPYQDAGFTLPEAYMACHLHNIHVEVTQIRRMLSDRE